MSQTISKRHFVSRQVLRPSDPDFGPLAGTAHHGDLIASFFPAEAKGACAARIAIREDAEGEIDVTRALYALCQCCQTDYLDAEDISCLFDVEPGKMRAPIYRKVELLVETLLKDIATGPAKRPGGTVAVVMRPHGTNWVVALIESGGSAPEDCEARRSAVSGPLASKLRGSLKVEKRPDGCITAVRFSAEVSHRPALEYPLH